MAMQTVEKVLRTTSLAFDIPFPPALVTAGFGEDVVTQAAATRTRFAPILTIGLWTIVQHASRLDNDTSGMTFCALLAARALRFGAAQIASVRVRKLA